MSRGAQPKSASRRCGASHPSAIRASAPGGRAGVVSARSRNSRTRCDWSANPASAASPAPSRSGRVARRRSTSWKRAIRAHGGRDEGVGVATTPYEEPRREGRAAFVVVRVTRRVDEIGCFAPPEIVGRDVAVGQLVGGDAQEGREARRLEADPEDARARPGRQDEGAREQARHERARLRAEDAVVAPSRPQVAEVQDQLGAAVREDALRRQLPGVPLERPEALDRVAEAGVGRDLAVPHEDELRTPAAYGIRTDPQRGFSAETTFSIASRESPKSIFATGL